MALNLKELKEWPPEIADLAQSARDAAANHTDSADFYRSLITVSTWEGRGAQAARSAMVATASDHDAAADNLGTAANRMKLSTRTPRISPRRSSASSTTPPPRRRWPSMRPPTR